MGRLLRIPIKMILPKILHRLGFTLRATANTFWGGTMTTVLPEAVSTSIWRYGFFESDVCTFMLTALCPGMTFIDVGAHFGFFSLMGSHVTGASGAVLSLEPTPSTARVLTRNVRDHAAHQNIRIFECAAFSERCELSFFDFGIEYSAYNSMGAFRSLEPVDVPATPLTIHARPLDEIVEESGLSSVGLMKIDAESSELQVLKGARKTIRKFRPSIIIETGDFPSHSDANTSEVVQWLLEEHLRPYELKSGTLVPHTMRQRYEYGNLLFRPE